MGRPLSGRLAKPDLGVQGTGLRGERECGGRRLGGEGDGRGPWQVPSEAVMVLGPGCWQWQWTEHPHSGCPLKLEPAGPRGGVPAVAAGRGSWPGRPEGHHFRERAPGAQIRRCLLHTGDLRHPGGGRAAGSGWRADRAARLAHASCPCPPTQHEALSEYRPIVTEEHRLGRHASAADKKLVLIPLIFICLRVWSTVRFVLTLCGSPAVRSPVLVVLHVRGAGPCPPARGGSGAGSRACPPAT